MACLEVRLLRIVVFGGFLSLATPGVVSAAQQVEITNTPLPVEVTKTPLPVTAVDNAAQNRFQAEATITTTANGITTKSFSHPANILVIEFVSGTCQTNLATKIIKIGFRTSAAGVLATHSFVPTLLFSTSSDHYYAVSQRTRIYADPNVSVNLQNEVLTSGPEVINCSIVASGYLTP